MKILNSIILLFCLVCYTNSTTQLNCRTPLECFHISSSQYIKDKDEMKDIKSSIENLLQKQSLLLDGKYNQIMSDVQNKIDSKITNKINQVSTQQYDYQSIIDNLNKKLIEKIEKISADVNSNIADVQIKNVVRSGDDNSMSPNRHYLYKEAIIYQDIYQALNTGVIKKVGNPVNIDDTSFRVNPWNKRKMLRMGMGAQPNGNGYKTTIPEGYNVLWLRVSNHVWFTVKVTYLDGNKEYMGSFAAGWRSLNEISPDGTTPDTNNVSHVWFNIAVSRPGEILMSTDVNCDGWVSGIAFGKNLWNHAKNSAVAFHWALNGGTNSEWETHDWNSDHLSNFRGGKKHDLFVPVHPSGKDKFIYFVEPNMNEISIMHQELSVNDVKIERFRTSYDNPFARHFNSKFYSRYIAARIPNDLIKPNQRFIKLTIDMTLSDHVLRFREFGTHDA